jgi:glutamine amidotransferase
MRSVAVIDYGMSNIDSVVRAIEECGGRPFVATAPNALSKADCIVLPGVGSFADGMRELRFRQLDEALRREALVNNIPVLGICLGMQMLATRGHEGGETPGLDLIPGDVVRFEPNGSGERIPHIGWNSVLPTRECPLFRGIDPGTDFYFVHSYHFDCADESAVAKTQYCGEFVCSVRRGYVFGVQFHPEKSQKRGIQLLRNFLSV